MVEQPFGRAPPPPPARDTMVHLCTKCHEPMVDVMVDVGDMGRYHPECAPKRQCDTCAFWSQRAIGGLCRRRSPTVGPGLEHWPATLGDDWCGDWAKLIAFGMPPEPEMPPNETFSEYKIRPLK